MTGQGQAPRAKNGIASDAFEAALGLSRTLEDVVRAPGSLTPTTPPPPDKDPPARS